MSDLDSEQIQSIQRILIDPLRETIRTEMRLNHDQMTDVLNRLEDAIQMQSDSHHDRLWKIVPGNKTKFTWIGDSIYQ